MFKQVSYDAVARQAMLRRVNKLAGAVQVTPGPKGTKVVRCALQNAGSIGGLMLTTGAVVSERPVRKLPRSRPRSRVRGMEGYD